MLRLCYRNAVSQRCCNISALSDCKEIVSGTKGMTAVHKIIGRHYASKKLSEDNKLEQIYYGPLTPQIKAVKIFSLSSSAAGLVAQPIIIKEASTIGSTSLLIAICSVVGFFTFVTPLLLHIITKKYVSEVYYNPDTMSYTAVTRNFFLVSKKLEFKAEDVVVPDIPGMFTTMHAKGTPLFIEARHFNDPMHYAKIMGYDKPLDFKLGNMEEPESSKK
ncbi:Transmembrane protein 70-like, mitochondrial [Papilio xuthus]|uniref:Transmembrane protein 70-like, mitochondrial n=1 Tax=Papilio xuthus TaxID=66420 RepID=A0A0N0PFC4_PAPXU|nr:Transmembrane protein 70-like, mitochondrial [Papilio xuthus]